MRCDHDQSYRFALKTLGAAVVLTATLAAGPVMGDSNTQGKNPAPAVKVKAPPLPIGSAQAVAKPGMSEEEWDKAYKETGRPPFSRKSVIKNGNNVQRD